MREDSHQERSPRRWTVAEFERMGEAGIFGPEERVELIDGEILPMSPENPEHAATRTSRKTACVARSATGSTSGPEMADLGPEP